MSVCLCQRDLIPVTVIWIPSSCSLYPCSGKFWKQLQLPAPAVSLPFIPTSSPAVLRSPWGNAKSLLTCLSHGRGSGGKSGPDYPGLE
ncbi:hypothetical protein ATANTOWER_029768 [Ataeniobius toweri]|uniref:Uncharacterized protein n=1 Tax=Ataeniobius toweri TaxID=208326 RepID=A0ABU7CJV0_9TELE|nr:hypothetical protein [Ataeniobius toweri]